MKKQIKLGSQCRLKPLEWKYLKQRSDYGEGDWEIVETWTAETIFGDLTIRHRVSIEPPEARPTDDGYRFEYCVAEYYDEGSEIMDSSTAGKKRAQQWYIDRIRNALEPL